MKKGLKKCLSIVLTIAMLVSVMSVSFVVNAAEGTAIINGTEYNVGDYVEVKKEITVNGKWVMSGQGTITYDNTVLEFIDTGENDMFPVLAGHGLFYHDIGGAINYNFLDLNGVDYTAGDVLYKLTFKVIGTTTEDNTLEEEIQEINTFPYAGDPTSGENIGKPIDNIFNVVDENGTISEANGEIKDTEITIPSYTTLNVNGQIYNVGDTVYVAKKISVNTFVQNIQANVTYDPEYLIFNKKSSSEMFPVVSKSNVSLVCNDVLNSEGEKTGEIRYNFTTLDGVDFTNEGYLYVFEFEVNKGAPETEVMQVGDAIEVMNAYTCQGAPTTPEEFLGAIDIVDHDTNDIAPQYGTTEEEPKIYTEYPTIPYIIINGTVYNKGDRINYYQDIKMDYWLIDAQVEITYDPSVLTLEENDDSINYPIVSKYVKVVDNNYLNSDGTSTILFNFTILDAIDFSQGGRLFDFYFTVRDDAEAGDYTIKTDIIDAHTLNYPGTPTGIPTGEDDLQPIAEDDKFIDSIVTEELVTELTSIDVDALNALIAEAEALAKDTMYTEDSRIDLQVAIAEAKKVAENPIAQTQVDAEVEALQAAIDALVLDTTALEEKIAEAEAIDTTGYSAESIEALTDAIAAGKAVAENPESAQQIADAIEAIDAAIEGLTPDTTALEEAIAEAEALDTTGYTAESIEALTDAIAAGKAVAENPESVQAVTDAIAAIEAAVEGLTPDTTALEEAIAEAEALDTTGYTAESIAALTDAIAAGKAVAENPESVQAVTDAIAAIEAAVEGLTPDTTALEEAIAEAEALDTTGYTAESIAALTDAIAAGKAVAENPESVQAVTDAIAAIEAAVEGLTPDTTALEEAIAAAKADLEKDYYSPTSKAVLEEKINAGEDIIAAIAAGESVTIQDVADATEAIINAQAALVKGVLLGDANNDGKVNIDDATYIQKYLAKLAGKAGDLFDLAADVNKDGKLTIADATAIQMRLATNTPDEYVFPDEA